MKNTNSKKRGRAYSLLGLTFLYGTLVSIFAYGANLSKQRDYEPFKLVCAARLNPGNPTIHKIEVKIDSGALVGLVYPDKKYVDEHDDLHVCPGDIVRWYSKDKNFAISFLRKNPMYGRCGVSIASFLTCDVRHDVTRRSHYPYNTVGTDGPKFGGLDPHIIVD